MPSFPDRVYKAVDRAPYAPPPAERRHEAPARVALETEVTLSSESNFFAGLSGDVRHGGLFVSTYRAPAVGTRVEVEVKVGEAVVRAEGVVRWSRPAGNDGWPPGVGVALDNLAPSSQRTIDAFCKHRTPLYYELDDAASAAG